MRPTARLDDLQARSVALAPDHPFVEGRRDLAPLEQEFAGGVENDLRVVKRAAIALVDAERNDDGMAARGACDRLRHWPRHDDGVFIEPHVLPAGQDRRAHEGEIGIPGHESFGKDDELRALARGLVDRGENALESSACCLQIRRDLHRGDADSRRRHLAISRFVSTGRQRVQVSRMKALSLRCSRIKVEHIERADRLDAGNQRTSPWP